MTQIEIEILAMNTKQMVDKLAEEVKNQKKSITDNDFHFFKTDIITPPDGQACWVKNVNGAQYRMTYPFNHATYPLWWPLPED